MDINEANYTEDRYAKTSSKFKKKGLTLFPARISNYCKTSGISRTKSQSLNVSCTCIFLQLSTLNPLKPGVELRMMM